MSRESASSKPRAASEIEIGSYPLLELMQYLKIPLSREHYLNLEYMGKVPAQLSPEQEADLPPQFRQPASPPEKPRKK
jgi:hypothetical protein